MKFTWFHLMPYRFLPDDFTQKYRSVWVDIPRGLYDPKIGHQLYNEYLDSLEFADLMGFDGLGVNEHHQNAYGMMPSPNIMAAALARRSSNANLVVLGNSIALYNPPIRVAEEFAMLDVLSGGRLVAGFPVGTSMDTNFCYGEPPATLRERYYEAHDLIVKAWTPMRCSPSTASTRNCATSICGPNRSSSRIRRSGFPAAARSKPGISAAAMTINIPTCHSSAIGTAVA